MTNWRRSREYQDAWQEAIKAYKVDHEGQGDFYYCALTRVVCHISQLDKFHILGAGAYPAIRMEALNLLPVCREAHSAYERLSTDDKKSVIDEILPGRWEALQNEHLLLTGFKENYDIAR